MRHGGTKDRTTAMLMVVCVDVLGDKCPAGIGFIMLQRMSLADVRQMDFTYDQADLIEARVPNALFTFISV